MLSISGLSPAIQSIVPRLRCRSSASMSILSAVYSRSKTLLKSSTITRGRTVSMRVRIRSEMFWALAKKIRPSGCSSKRPGKVSSSECSLELGRKTSVPGLRPSTCRAGLSSWYNRLSSDRTMAMMMPCRVPTNTTPANAARAHTNSMRRIRSISANS